MEEQITLDQYIYAKWVKALIFTNDYKNLFKDYKELIYGNEMLGIYLLGHITEKFSGMLDSTMKENILELNSYFKYMLTETSNESKEEISDISNKIISLVNVSDFNKKDVINFCKSELYDKGYSSIESFKLCSKKNIESTFAFLKYLIVQEFVVLDIVYDEDEIYNEKKYNYGNPSYSFIQSILSNIKECPSLLLYEIFYERVYEILNIFNTNLNSLKHDKKKVKNIAFEKKINALREVMKKSTNN